MKKMLIAAATACILLFPLTVSAQEYLAVLKEEIAIPYSEETDITRLPTTNKIICAADDIETFYEYTDKNNIESIIYNCDVELFSEPNDPYYTYQWNLVDINSVFAFENGLRGDGVKIGIIDSGITPNHEDISCDKIVRAYNIIDGSDDVTDSEGHGTFVAGIIAANTDNETGVSGIADHADLAIYKAFEGNKTKLDAIFTAIDMAINENCDVINMSFGLPQTKCDQETIDLFNQYAETAAAQNTILIAAVGNNGSSLLNYPAACEKVIGVGATTKTRERLSISNYNESVTVTAPGDYIVSTWYPYTDSYSPVGGIYTGTSNNRGTSYSAPIVTAMAALAKQADNDISADNFKTLLSETSTDLGDSGYDTHFGYGLVNIEHFTKALFEKYPFFASSCRHRGEFQIFNHHSENTVMYTADYAGELLININSVKLPYGTSSYPLTSCDGSDMTKLFFWEYMKPVWYAAQFAGK